MKLHRKQVRVRMNTKNLCEREIRSLLHTSDMQIRIFDEIDSTNKEARRLAEQGIDERLLLIARVQTSGRGRMGRDFYSPADTGIYMTYLWRPDAAAGDVISVTTAAAVAVHRALSGMTVLADKSFSIKWVNDIYLANKKVCGILAEAITDPQDGKIRYIWIGIGINVVPMVFPDELKNIAGSLDASGLDRNELIANIMNELLDIMHDRDCYAHMPYYRKHSMVIGKAVNTICAEKINSGTVLDIDREGGLVIERSDGTVETIHSGEITLRLQ